ncbi:MAG: antibiotic biosynthesis monooxygenase family protein [Flavobacteriales bacterium]
MVVRVVKMTFRQEECARFLELFAGWRQRISIFPGCRHLELLHATDDTRVFMTYSEWDSDSDLENYRKSDVFASVWPTVKAMFEEPAAAWSMERL